MELEQRGVYAESVREKSLSYIFCYNLGMLRLISGKALPEDLAEAAKDLEEYVKFVVDINREVVTLGGKRHFEGEQLLLGNGSKQSDLWGGGFDTISHTLDFEAVINIRPNDNNPSKEVLSQEIRQKILIILKKKTPWKI